MCNPILEQIQYIIQKDELSNEEMVFIFSNKVDNGNGVENIKLFNDWVRRRYNYNSNLHKVITLKYIEIRNVDLTKIDLRYANIIKCKFIKCNFSNALMGNCNIVNSIFDECIFSGILLRNARIDNCKLNSVYAEGDLNFLETKIVNSRISIDNKNHNNFTSIDFSNSILENLTITIPTISRESSYEFINPTGMDNNNKISNDKIYQLIFKYCTIQGLRLVNLTIFKFIADYAVIRNSDIINTYVEHEISISNLILNNLRVKREFFKIFYNSIMLLIEDKSDKTINQELYETILILRDNFGNINDTQSKNIFYVLSKEYERHKCRVEGGKKLKQYLILTFYKISTGYGLSPTKLFKVVLGVVIFCGILGRLFKLTDAPSLLGNLYLSLITFVTVGYGDYKPICWQGKILFGLEGFLGAILMSIFVVVLTKITFDE